MDEMTKVFGSFGQRFYPGDRRVFIPAHWVDLERLESEMLQTMMSEARAFSVSDLRECLWPGQALVGRKNLQKITSDLHVKMGERCIETLRDGSRKFGCPVGNDSTEVPAEDYTAKELIVFPSVRRRAFHGHPRSSFDHGNNDSVGAVQEFLEWMHSLDEVVPYESNRNGEVINWRALALRFEHRAKDLPDANNESWWCANLALDANGHEQWPARDISRFSHLQFTAHLAFPPNSETTINVRLLDNSRDSHEPHHHRSTSWQSRRIGPAPESYRISLKEEFDWQNHWANTDRGPARDTGVVQVTFGQDENVSDGSGLILLTDVRFI